MRRACGVAGKPLTLSGVEGGPPMSDIKIAVIGAEQLDPDHHLALNRLSETGLVTAYALDETAIADGRMAIESAMQHSAVEAVILAGHPSDAADWIAIALDLGAPIYSTHAVPETIEDLIEIRRIEQSRPDAILQFALTARHHESALVARSKAETGEYGNLLTLRGVCGLDGPETEGLGTIFEPGAQMVDLMQAFAGPFQDIAGFADLERTDQAGTERNIFATLRTYSGSLASVHVSNTQWRSTFRLELGFERGYMWLEGLMTERYNFCPEALIYAKTDGSQARHETVDQFPDSDGAMVALHAFLSRVRVPAQPAIGTSQEAFDTLNTIHRILAADPIFSPIQERQVS